MSAAEDSWLDDFEGFLDDVSIADENAWYNDIRDEEQDPQNLAGSLADGSERAAEQPPSGRLPRPRKTSPRRPRTSLGFLGLGQLPPSGKPVSAASKNSDCSDEMTCPPGVTPPLSPAGVSCQLWPLLRGQSGSQ